MALMRGEWATCRVWIDDREVLPERSLAVRNHSPTGFGWGYGGSGPAQLALALLLEITTKEMAVLWYQEVKRQVVAKLPQADFTLDSQVIIDFIVHTTVEALGSADRPAMGEAFDTYHCPTHGARRDSRGEVRQAERDETCVYVCTVCGQVADPEFFEE
jgi:hypothetical protein